MINSGERAVGRHILLKRLLNETPSDRTLDLIKQIIEECWVGDDIGDVVGVVETLFPDDYSGNSARASLRMFYSELMRLIEREDDGLVKPPFHAPKLRAAILEKILQGWSGVNSDRSVWNNPEIAKRDMEESFDFFCASFLQAIKREEEDVQKAMRAILREHLYRMTCFIDIDRWILRDGVPWEILLALFKYRVSDGAMWATEKAKIRLVRGINLNDWSDADIAMAREDLLRRERSIHESI